MPYSLPVSIHAFRGEGDLPKVVLRRTNRQFQSTPSGGKATGRERACTRLRWRFNPRLPGGRRRQHLRNSCKARRFNPRLPGGRRHRLLFAFASLGKFQSTPSGGKATLPFNLYGQVQVFQSTPSGGKATCWQAQSDKHYMVSIHAFRGEGDRKTTNKVRFAQRFNPRLPGGRRPNPADLLYTRTVFQSTPSGGKATTG